MQIASDGTSPALENQLFGSISDSGTSESFTPICRERPALRLASELRRLRRKGMLNVVVMHSH